MAKKIRVTIIDPQNSFCKVVGDLNDPVAAGKEQQRLHDGELCVKGAWADMERVAAMIRRLGDKIDEIDVTLDSHHLLHISHPIWWRNLASDQPPTPFTLLREEKGNIIGSQFINGSMQDVGEFTTYRPSYLKKSLDYLKALANAKRYPHCIWPPHCLIGTVGHAIVAPLADAIFEWEQKNFASANKITKGSNHFVEHFSALQAEVTDPADPSTQLNTDFLDSIIESDEILLCGEASSHCLANTVRDMFKGFKDGNDFIRKAVLLKDGTSPVPGFQNFEDDFLKEMTSKGMRVTTTVDYLK
jgi:nicotinamidase-related amidase